MSFQKKRHVEREAAAEMHPAWMGRGRARAPSPALGCGGPLGGGEPPLVPWPTGHGSAVAPCGDGRSTDGLVEGNRGFRPPPGPIFSSLPVGAISEPAGLFWCGPPRTMRLVGDQRRRHPTSGTDAIRSPDRPAAWRCPGDARQDLVGRVRGARSTGNRGRHRTSDPEAGPSPRHRRRHRRRSNVPGTTRSTARRIRRSTSDAVLRRVRLRAPMSPNNIRKRCRQRRLTMNRTQSGNSDSGQASSGAYRPSGEA